jgi:tetratricopeptide (TPR) repeat protein
MKLLKPSKYIFCFALALLSISGCKTSKSISSANSRDAIVLSPEQSQMLSSLFVDATGAKMLGNYGVAMQIFQQCLEIDPSNATVQYEIARIHAQAGNYNNALPYAQRATELDPENIWFADFLGQLYAELGQFDMSVLVFESIIDNHPESLDYYFNLGNLYVAQGKYDDALKVYSKLEKQVGVNEELVLQRQIVYIEQGDFDKALSEIDKLILAQPNELQYYGMKAEILEESGKVDEAIVIYEQMLETEPSNGLVLVSLYEIYLSQNNNAKADEYLAKAFASPELNIDVKVNILLNYMAGADLKANREQLIELVNNLEIAHPLDAKTYAVQGDLYFNLGEYVPAREAFREAVEIDPNKAPIWQQIVTIDSQLSEFEAMRDDSEIAMELFPQQPIFYLFNGVALLQDGEIEEAIKVLNMGKNLVVDSNGALAQFYASLGDAYHEAGDNKMSDESYTKALKYDPNNVVVLNNFAYYLSLRKENLENAEKMAKKANSLSPNQATFQDTYAWVLYCRGNYQNALFWIEEALKYGGDTDPVVYEHYGDILIKVNRPDDAINAWQKALELGGDPEVLNPKIESR